MNESNPHYLHNKRVNLLMDEYLLTKEQAEDWQHLIYNKWCSYLVDPAVQEFSGFGTSQHLIDLLCKMRDHFKDDSNATVGDRILFMRNNSGCIKRECEQLLFFGLSILREQLNRGLKA